MYKFCMYKMKRSFSFFACVLVLLFSASSLHCQQITLLTEDGKQVVLTRADIDALPQVKVTTSDKAGPAIFEGVSLKSVLEKAGVGFGDSLRGKRLASCLLVEAADGYRVVIALPELDPAFVEKQILLADKRNGKDLDDVEGPYRLVIPDEKHMARWVRQVKALKIIAVK